MLTRSRGRQEHGLGAGDGGQLAGQPVRLHLDTGVAVTADDLHHPVQRGTGPGRHGLGGGEQRGAPGRHAEDLAAHERRAEVLRGGGTEGRGNLPPGPVHVDDDGVPEAELLLELLLQVGIDTGRQGDDGTDHADLAGLAQQP